MRTVKILLILALAVVSVLYGVSAFSARTSGKNDPPVMTCSQEPLDISVAADAQALLSGLTASDPQDGDLTARIRISGVSKLFGDNLANVSCIVFDSDNNMATLTRQVHYTDYTSPRFSIKKPLTYYMNESIALLDRISVTDVFDGDITSFVRVSSLRATSDPETYSVDIQVTNSMGDTVRLTLPVIQLEGHALRPTVMLTGYLVYLKQGGSFDARSYLRGVDLPDDESVNLRDVQITGTVDTAKPGVYTVRYTYPYDGTSGCAILTVVVE